MAINPDLEQLRFSSLFSFLYIRPLKGRFLGFVVQPLLSFGFKVLPLRVRARRLPRYKVQGLLGRVGFLLFFFLGGGGAENFRFWVFGSLGSG